MEQAKITTSSTAQIESEEEVSTKEWKFIEMTEQEEDLIFRMYRLVGERWNLIAGRIPDRKAEEIERFWIMRNLQVYAERSRKRQKKDTPFFNKSLDINKIKFI